MRFSKIISGITTGIIGIGIVVMLYACSDAAEQADDAANTPKNVIAQSGDTAVTLSWAPVEGAEKYIVCWAYVTIDNCDPSNPRVIFKEGVGNLNPDTNRIEWTHAGITNDTVYQYVIIAYAESWGGNSSLSVNISGAPLALSINPPKVVTVSANGVVPTISWHASENATQYNLYMSTQPNVTKDNYNSAIGGMKHSIPSSQLSFQHAPLNLGETYYFVLTAERVIGNEETIESTESQEVQMIPKSTNPLDTGYLPTDFSVSSGFSELQPDGLLNEYITFNWSSPCEYANSNIYSVYWSTAPITEKPLVCESGVNCIGDLTVDTSNQIIDYLDSGTNYYFAILTTYNNLCIQGSPMTTATMETQLSSNIAIKTPGNIVPIKPLITATPGVNAITIEVDVTTQDPSLKYNLYMAANGSCDAGKPLTVTNYRDDTVWGMVHTNIPSTFRHVALPGGIPFCFIVTSINDTGTESIASDQVTVTPN